MLKKKMLSIGIYFLAPLLALTAPVYTYINLGKPFINRSVYGKLCQTCKSPFFPDSESCPVCSKAKKNKKSQMFLLTAPTKNRLPEQREQTEVPKKNLKRFVCFALPTITVIFLYPYFFTFDRFSSIFHKFRNLKRKGMK